MKIENFSIIFFIIFMCLTIPVSYRLVLTQKQMDENELITERLHDSCVSALSIIDNKENNVFSDLNIRKKTIQTFFTTLAELENRSLNNPGIIETRIPVILLADTNGYYLSYLDTYQGGSGETYSKRTISVLYPYTETYKVNSYYYTIQYNLNDDIFIWTNDDTIQELFRYYEGSYEKAIAKMPHLANIESSIAGEKIYPFQSKEAFELEKNRVIIQSINTKLEYYINLYNESNVYHTNYRISLPFSAEEKTAKPISYPSLFVFYQGAQHDDTKGYVNIYSFVATELTKAPEYHLAHGYYHKKDCPLAADASYIGSMGECASKGAIPHTCVY